LWNESQSQCTEIASWGVLAVYPRRFEIGFPNLSGKKFSVNDSILLARIIGERILFFRFQNRKVSLKASQFEDSLHMIIGILEINGYTLLIECLVPYLTLRPKRAESFQSFPKKTKDHKPHYSLLSSHFDNIISIYRKPNECCQVKKTKQLTPEICYE